MEETSDELPNFSIGIDFLGPDPTSNKNKAEKKTRKLHVSQICRKTSCTWVHLGLIFSIFPVSFSFTVSG